MRTLRIKKAIKITLIFAILLALGFGLIKNAVATDDACEVAGYDDPLICGNSGSDEEVELMGRIKDTLNVVYLWIGILAVVFVIVGGVSYMTSQGDPEKVRRSKMTIMYSLCGLVVSLSAFAITALTINALDGRTGGSGGGGDLVGAGRDKVKGIISVSDTTLIAGQSVTLHPKIVPDYAKNKKLSFSSSDENIASVDKTGKVKAKRAGDVKITIKSDDGPSKTVSVKVQKPIPVESIKLSSTKIELEKGKSQTIKATVSPANAANKTLTWKTSNAKVATVSQSGVIKGINDGEAVVSVSAFNREVFASSEEFVLAASSVPEGTTVVSKVKVSVSSGKPQIAGNMENTKYSMRLDFRPETRKIINQHNKDFYYNDAVSELKKRGGYTKYVKDLKGIFTYYSNVKKIPIKTAADLQAAAEYVWGLWTIWGTDYGNGDYHVNWGSGASDGFYRNQPNRESQLSYAHGSINSMLRESGNIRTNCNLAIDTFYLSTALPNNRFGRSAVDINQHLKTSKKITNVSDLRVGDLVHFYKAGHQWHHIAMVGEVYKDYVVFYDGGSRWIRTAKFKKISKRNNNSTLTNDYGGESDWFGVRVWDIDQSKTLKGIN